MPSVHLCSLHINQHWTPQKSKLATGVILKLKLKEATGTSVLEPHVIWICLSLRLHCTAFCLDPSSDSVHFCGFFLWQTVCSPVCWGAAYPCTFCMNLALEDCIYKYIFIFTTETPAFGAWDFTGIYFSKTGVALHSEERIPYPLQSRWHCSYQADPGLSSFAVCCNFHHLQSSV